MILPNHLGEVTKRALSHPRPHAVNTEKVISSIDELAKISYKPDEGEKIYYEEI